MQEAVRNLPGPRKLGEKAFAEQQATKSLRTRDATVYGNRKGGKDNKPKPIPLAHDKGVEVDTGDASENPFVKENGDRVSIGAMELLLEKDPGSLDVAIETELSHRDDPRKGAVEILTRLEGERPDGPRESVMELLGKLG